MAQRPRNDLVELEFDVRVDDAIRDEELRQRLEAEVHQLQALLQGRVRGLEIGEDHQDALREPLDFGYRPRVRPGVAFAETNPYGDPQQPQPSRPGGRSMFREEIRGSSRESSQQQQQQQQQQQMLQQHMRQMQQGVQQMQQQQDDLQEQDMQQHSSSFEERRSLSPRFGFRARSAPPASRRVDLLNHVSVPVAPSFLRDGYHWQQMKGRRIRERRLEEQRLQREQEEEPPPPFKARPVPASVIAPRFRAMQAANHVRSEEPQRGRARQHSAGGGVGFCPQPITASEPTPVFHARPVPWIVSAPLYDKMRAEEERARQQRVASRSRSLLRSSSLPPRLEAMRQRYCSTRRSREESPRSLSPERRRGSSEERQGLAAVAVGRAEALPGREPGASDETLHAHSHSDLSRALALSYAFTPPQHRAASSGSRTPNRYRVDPYGGRGGAAEPHPRGGLGGTTTTMVPDFAAIHERERIRLERRKQQNRYVTKPDPFVFHAPTRVHLRPPAPTTDPSKDWRWNRPTRRPASAGCVGRLPFSAPPLENPPEVRTTEKALQATQATARRLQERREREKQNKEDLERAHAVPAEMRRRVKDAVGPTRSIDEVIEAKVLENRRARWEKAQDQRRKLKDMETRVNRRPLLMEQNDHVSRARRRALFKVRVVLNNSKVRDTDRFFRDDELDEMEREEWRGAARRSGGA